MGKGDRKTKKGKIFKGSYGVRRPKANNKRKFDGPNRPPKSLEKPKAKKEAEKKEEETKEKKTTTKKKPAAKKSATKEDEK